jgi:hypothetical protein
MTLMELRLFEDRGDGTEVPPTKSVVGTGVTGTFPRLNAIAGKRPVCHQPFVTSPWQQPVLAGASYRSRENLT